MPNDTVIKLIQPGTFNDQLTDVLRNGARALLAQAVEAEVADFLGTHADLKTEDGQARTLSNARAVGSCGRCRPGECGARRSAQSRSRNSGPISQLD